MAESIYWMSRYLERAANTARLVEINLLHMIEAEDALTEENQWRPLLAITGMEQGYQERYGDAITAGKALHFMVQDAANPGSIRQALRMARENARIVRDRISKEMWETINEFWLTTQSNLTPTLRSDQAAEYCATMRREGARFHGHTIGTMMRGDAYLFYLIGTFVERADMTARILDVKYHTLLPKGAAVGSALDYYQWAALLKSLSGFEAYRRLHQGGMNPAEIVGFVIFSEQFPRSIRFGAEGVGKALAKVQKGAGRGKSLVAMQALQDHLESHGGPEQIINEGLHEFLQGCLGRINDVNLALAHDYFDMFGNDDLAAVAEQTQ